MKQCHAHVCLVTQQSEAVNILEGKKYLGTTGTETTLISFEPMEHKSFLLCVQNTLCNNFLKVA